MVWIWTELDMELLKLDISGDYTNDTLLGTIQIIGHILYDGSVLFCMFTGTTSIHFVMDVMFEIQDSLSLFYWDHLKLSSDLFRTMSQLALDVKILSNKEACVTFGDIFEYVYGNLLELYVFTETRTTCTYGATRVLIRLFLLWLLILS